MSNTFLLIRFGLEPPRITAIASAGMAQVNLALLIEARMDVGRKCTNFVLPASRLNKYLDHPLTSNWQSAEAQ